MMAFIVNLTGLVFIALIIWWFIIYKPKAKKIKDNVIDILVQDGLYSPSIIKANLGEILHLRFIRKDETPCSKVVVFDRLNINAELPINKPHIITVAPKEKGEYGFTCQMGMYRGKLIIE